PGPGRPRRGRRPPTAPGPGRGSPSRPPGRRTGRDHGSGGRCAARARARHTGAWWGWTRRARERRRSPGGLDPRLGPRGLPPDRAATRRAGPSPRTVGDGAAAAPPTTADRAEGRPDVGEVDAGGDDRDQAENVERVQDEDEPDEGRD